MKRLIAFFLLVSCCSLCRADQLDEIIKETQSSTGTYRLKGFRELRAYISPNPTDTRAIKTLVDFVHFEESGRAPADDDGIDGGDLISALVAVDNPTTIPPLVELIGTGNMAPSRLAGYGKLALNPVIARAQDKDWIVRKCVMLTLAFMLSPDNLPKVNDPDSMKKIKDTLNQGLQDPSPFVSETARRGIQLLPK